MVPGLRRQILDPSRKSIAADQNTTTNIHRLRASAGSNPPFKETTRDVHPRGHFIFGQKLETHLNSKGDAIN